MTQQRSYSHYFWPLPCPPGRRGAGTWEGSWSGPRRNRVHRQPSPCSPSRTQWGCWRRLPTRRSRRTHRHPPGPRGPGLPQGPLLSWPTSAGPCKSFHDSDAKEDDPFSPFLCLWSLQWSFWHVVFTSFSVFSRVFTPVLDFCGHF